MLWLNLGLASLALGVIGIVLPLLPTTPFLLLSAFAFLRSSPRLHVWLIGHPRFGPPIRDWSREGAIGRRAKIAAIVAMAAAFAASLIARVDQTILIVQAVVLICASAFILSRPTPRRADIDSPLPQPPPPPHSSEKS
ncbi:MAG: YbaN family protein [Pseudomonadota bacterium]